MKNEHSLVVAEMIRGWVVYEGEYYRFIPNAFASNVKFCLLGNDIPEEAHLCWYEAEKLKYIHEEWLQTCGYFSYRKKDHKTIHCRTCCQ
ncbi:MAG: hypothetical protein IPN70_04235 [Candidatus Moraniibacteriota bacterium]|nr:MAG: hypothetical protein IPN70_04235 [Candidatus Moranbacteria bacterium]